MMASLTLDAAKIITISSSNNKSFIKLVLITVSKPYKTKQPAITSLSSIIRALPLLRMLIYLMSWFRNAI